MTENASVPTLDYASPVKANADRKQPRGGLLFVCFFVSAQFWLLVALTLWLGEKVERSSPEMDSFFGIGGWFDPGWYAFTLILCVALGISLLFLAMKARPLSS
jgi:hypothetical protein